MTDVVLVFPKTGTMDVRGVMVEVPQSLLCISAYLEKAGLSVKVIDQRIEKDWKKILQKSAPRFVGISSMTGKQIHYGLEVSKAARKCGATVVWGGIHPSLMPDQAIANEFVDVVVVGEGEETMVELVQRKDWKNVKGLVFKKDSKVIKTPPRKYIDLNKMPPLPYHLFRMEEYLIPFIGTRAIHVHTSRGCPNRCTFCYNIMFNNGTWRPMNAKKVADLVETAVKKFNLGGVVFTEDNFFVDLNRVKEIFMELDRRNMHIKWKADCRADYLDRMPEEFIKFLEDHGLDTLSIGVESGSQRMLDKIKKEITVEQVHRVNRKLAKTSITPRYSFMLGFPNEIEEDRKATLSIIIKIIEENNKAMIGIVSIFSPYPGCELYEDSLKKGFVPPATMEEWAGMSVTSTDMKFVEKPLRKKLENISFMSRFVDGISVDRYLKNKPLMRFLAMRYVPVVRSRWKKGAFTSFMPELEVIKLLYNMGLIK